MEPITLDNAGWGKLIMLLGASALASYSITQVFKLLLRGKMLSDSRRRRAFLRALSVVLGGSFGYVLAGYTGFGAILGIGAGSLTTYVFAAIRARIKAAGQSERDF